MIKFGTARGSECGHTAEMPAYFRSTVEEFLATASDSVLARLTQGYVRDGFASMQAEAHTAFEVSISRIRESLLQAVAQCDSLKLAGILLEFPIYRLRKRIDAKWHRSAREVSIEREKCRAARLRECEVGGVVGCEAMRLGESYELSKMTSVG